VTTVNALRSEWWKLRTARMTVGLAIAAILFTVVNAGVLVALAGVDLEGQDLPALTDPDALRALYGVAGQASVFTLVLGLLSMTSEYRHQTITATLLATPRRGRLVAAKMGAASVAAAIIAALCVAASLVVLLVGTALRDTAPLDWPVIAATAGGILLGLAVYAVLGVGFGSLVRNQIAAITAALLWVLLIESLVVSFWPEVGKWLPAGALAGVLQAESFSGVAYLAPLPAALLLLAYAVGFGLIAVRTTLRRDIT